MAESERIPRILTRLFCRMRCEEAKLDEKELGVLVKMAKKGGHTDRERTQAIGAYLDEYYEYGVGDLRYSSPHTSRPISRASSQASVNSLTSSTASSLSHLPRRSHSSHTPTRGSRRSLRQTRSASRSNRSNSFCGYDLPGGLSTSSVNLDSQEDVATLITTLRRERSRLLQEIEAEEEERAWFYSQLENLNQQLRRFAAGENVSTNILNEEQKRRCLYLAAALAIVEEQLGKAGRGRRARNGNPTSKKNTKESVGQGMVNQKA
ncbi:adenomatous polyposis coli protein-like [Palaemon carinicauda]|uniref:adenomatous polyposis coli protein-like n=1 Tax=Palaemon carinicauda TaxID=392227 RepID=UPI0035B5CEB3